MRNTTKLKQILQSYSLTAETGDDGLFRITLVHKEDYSRTHFIEGKSWSIVLSKAYSLLMKENKSAQHKM